MMKIKYLHFIDHPILGNLLIDFTLPNGQTADTIIFAGENGTGKSTILNEIYTIPKNFGRMGICFEENGSTTEYEPINTGNKEIRIKKTSAEGSLKSENRYLLFIQNETTAKAVFSDVAINYNARPINSITSSELDTNSKSIRSGSDTATQIEQLLIDIYNQDSSDFMEEVEEKRAKNEDFSNVQSSRRIRRFTNAFNLMFDDLKFKKIANIDNRKAIIFQKNGIDVNINALSSGERQIVYRGGFLLKDINSNKGAFILIDEPETTLHPNWQKKILHFYKSIFSDEAGNQTSQLFVVTHSPFIIHSDDKSNTKIIVLQRDKEGKIVVQDSPEYYSCDSIKAIEDAFNIRDFSDAKPTIYLEGRTDVRYFQKALELSGTADFPFVFKWVGHIDANGQEANTGKDALNKAFQFLISQNPTKLNICLSDCDTKLQTKKRGNVLSMALPQFENNPAGITKGIENALCVSKDFFDRFVKTIEKIDGYGLKSIRPEPDKMKMCDTICDSLEPKEQREILANLITQLENLKQLYTEHVEAVTNVSNV